MDNSTSGSATVLRSVRKVYSSRVVLYVVVYKHGLDRGVNLIVESIKKHADKLISLLPDKRRPLQVCIEHISFDRADSKKSSVKTLMRRWKLKTFGWLITRRIQIQLNQERRLPFFESKQIVSNALRQYWRTKVEETDHTRGFAFGPLFSGLVNFANAMRFAFQPQALAERVRDGEVSMKDLVIVVSAASLFSALLTKFLGYPIFPGFNIPVVDQLMLIALVLGVAGLIIAPIHLWQAFKNRKQLQKLVSPVRAVQYFGISFAVLYPVVIAVGAFLSWLDFESITGLRTPKTGALLFFVPAFGLAELYRESPLKLTFALAISFNFVFWGILLAIF